MIYTGGFGRMREAAGYWVHNAGRMWEAVRYWVHNAGSMREDLWYWVHLFDTVLLAPMPKEIKKSPSYIN